MNKNILFLSGLAISLVGCDSATTNHESQGSKQAIGSQGHTLMTAAEFAQSLDVKHELITNRVATGCDKSKTDGHCYRAELQLTASGRLTDKSWQIRFSNMSPIQKDESDLFDIVHLNGDLHQIIPTDKFTQFEPGKTYHIPFYAGFWMLGSTDRMPNYYLVDEQNNAHVIQSTVAKTDPETGLEILPHATPLSLAPHHFKRTVNDNTPPATAQWLFEENKPFYQDADVTYSILPTPKSVKAPKMAGNLDLSSGIQWQFEGFDADAFTAAQARLQNLGVNTAENGVLFVVTKVDGLGKEAYKLATTRSGIEIVATTETGAFYGMQSIASLMSPITKTVPFVAIEDEPRFEFRGMHVDVSRNFKSKEFILSVLDQMAAYKLNKFHFHLADDEGWRVEIAGLPELTEVGAYRCHDSDEVNCLLPQLGAGPDKDTTMNGYYSIADYQEILRYATERHIQVIPSMDMPGHSRAAIKSMEARYKRLNAAGKSAEARQFLLHDIEDTTAYESIQFYNDNTINACMDSSYDFISKVVDELQLMHAQSFNPLTKYHIGADETAGAWVESSACESLLKNNVTGIESAEDIAAYFVERVSQLLAKKGIEAAGWNDGMGHTKKSRMPEVVQSNAWSPLFWGGHTAAHEQANRDWQLVVSSPDALYFDFPYEADPFERGYYWAARRVNTRKLFTMMPENLPAHAEYWLDRQENPYTADDTLKRDENGKITQQPLKKGTRFHGIQGQLWSETVRTDNQASYMIFPRLYALAERAWYKADWELDYNYEGAVYSSDTRYFNQENRDKQKGDWIRFANHLAKKTLPKSDSVGLFYRLPTPGAIIKDGQLHVNSLYPGLDVEYQVADSGWQKYTGTVVVGKNVKVRTVAPNGKRKSRSLAIN